MSRSRSRSRSRGGELSFAQDLSCVLGFFGRIVAVRRVDASSDAEALRAKEF
jgi:hypothetical protein